jgi:hypothetical protein
MPFYHGVRKFKTDRGWKYEARLGGTGVNSRCLGFFSSAEQAAREYNKHAAPLGLELNLDIDASFTRVRAADGEVLLLCTCGQCGKSARMPKSSALLCCGRQYTTPADVEALPIERSERQAKVLRQMRRQLDRMAEEDMREQKRIRKVVQQ